ncbi:MAG: helix-turn-helix domain-containing protein [Geobacteraceae bacterium]|nr:helix-turn-helix domain-containing protein [Geobacteraceae bacterium]
MDNPEQNYPLDANLRIDGEVIRRLREEQGLTQLYVAKVVGVTSDTISRWENNRYPSIKTANAQRLAEALEVEVDVIVQHPADEATEDVRDFSPPARFTRVKMVLWGAGIVVVVTALMLGWRLLSAPNPDVWAERLLPSYAAPGAEVPVKLTFTGSAARVVVREQIPTGWELVAAHPEPDSFDPASGLMRWIMEVGQESVSIHYLTRVAEKAPLHSLQKFSGELVLRSEVPGHGRTRMVGANQLVVEQVHWADLNADNRIDDDEMLDASYLAESAGSLSLGMEKLEKLWMAEHYYWDPDVNEFIGVEPEFSVDK